MLNNLLIIRRFLIARATSAGRRFPVVGARPGSRCTRRRLRRAPGARQTTRMNYTVVPDPEWPKMYRVRRPDGSLTDVVNLTRGTLLDLFRATMRPRFRTPYFSGLAGLI
jgi:hypothetical protein